MNHELRTHEKNKRNPEVKNEKQEEDAQKGANFGSGVVSR